MTCINTRNESSWRMLFLVLWLISLNTCDSRSERIRNRNKEVAYEVKETQRNRHHGDDRDGKEAGEIDEKGGELRDYLRVEGNSLVYRDGRTAELLGIENTSRIESYLKQSFSQGIFQNPVVFTFDSKNVPRRPEKTKALKGYLVDAQGISINGHIIKEKVSPFFRFGVTDSLYAFDTYAKTDYGEKGGIDIDLLKKANFQIRVFDDFGNLKGTGSGFFVSPEGVGISNYHVFENGNHFELVRCSDGFVFGVKTILEESIEDDWIAFSVDPDAEFEYLSLAGEESTEGDQVYVYGNPKDLTCSLTKGIISAVRKNGNRIQIDAAISPGNSGSPVVNTDSEVIGIATYKREFCENCNFAVSASLFSSFFRN